MNILIVVIIMAVLLPVLWVSWAIFCVLVIEPYRKRASYLVSVSGPREPGDGFYFTYHEKGKELYFFGDDLENTIYLPSEDLWRNSMPDFFTDRYNITFNRLKGKMGKHTSLRIRIVDDYNQGCSILYVDHDKTGPDRTATFGEAAQQWAPDRESALTEVVQTTLRSRT